MCAFGSVVGRIEAYEYAAHDFDGAFAIFVWLVLAVD